jgi:hypothetical protein
MENYGGRACCLWALRSLIAAYWLPRCHRCGPLKQQVSRLKQILRPSYPGGRTARRWRQSYADSRSASRW